MQSVKKTRIVYKDLLKEAIYEEICNGTLKPGDHIVELEWSKRFEVSQAPVREAIRDLESQGVVVTIPFKGTFVREMTIKDLRDIHQIRSGLEGVALKNAIMKASDAEIESVNQVLNDMIAAAKEGDQEKFLDLDIRFHERIVEIAHTTELEKMWDLCNVRMWTIFTVAMSKTDMIVFAESHRPIYEVLKKREKEKAYMIMDRHFDDVLDGTLDENNT